MQRSVQAGRQGLTEEKYDELLNFADSDKFTEKEKIALTYTSAIAWNADIADDGLWAKLHESCTRRHVEVLTRLDATIAALSRYIENVDRSLHEFKDLMTSHLIAKK